MIERRRKLRRDGWEQAIRTNAKAHYEQESAKADLVGLIPLELMELDLQDVFKADTTVMLMMKAATAEEAMKVLKRLSLVPLYIEETFCAGVNCAFTKHIPRSRYAKRPVERLESRVTLETFQKADGQQSTLLFAGFICPSLGNVRLIIYLGRSPLVTRIKPLGATFTHTTDYLSKQAERLWPVVMPVRPGNIGESSVFIGYKPEMKEKKANGK